jgi:hypothetical protein
VKDSRQWQYRTLGYLADTHLRAVLTPPQALEVSEMAGGCDIAV